MPDHWLQGHHAAGSQVQPASLAALAGYHELVDARKALALLDLVDLCVHARQELLLRQERFDVDSPEEAPRRV